MTAAVLIALGSAGSAASGDAPAILRGEDGQNYLEIPGIGRIPIPPGAKVFQPPAAPRFEGDSAELKPRAREAAPKAPKTADQARAAALDDLLARLKNAADEPEARAIGAKILGVFAGNASDTIGLLTARALAAETGGAREVARALLDYVIVLDPRWSEGFVRRARAKAAVGDGPGAREDLEAALRLEPRRFDALSLLGALLEESGDKKAALAAYRGALALDPKQEALQKIEQRLRFDVEGRDI
ncbi:MAG: hypothetical protein WB816_16115 [Methylocystis sp.]